MCVAFWSLDHPEYALILCSNRDEFLSRPTAPAHFHAFEPPSAPAAPHDASGPVLSGRDLRAGGTWLGLARDGRFALLTNVTEPYGVYPHSRGELVSSFLIPSEAGIRASSSALEAAQHLASRDGQYAGFNLLLLSPKTDATGSVAYDAAHVTNHGALGDLSARALAPAECACGGMSNGVDGRGAEQWPKVQIGTRALQEALAASASGEPEDALLTRLFEILGWHSAQPPSDRAELRHTIEIDPLELPPTASAPRGSAREYYGTRLATCVLVRRDGAVLFVEREVWVLGADGRPARADVTCEPGAQRVFRFALDARRAP